MKLITSELLQFKALSVGIKQNAIIPILEYLHFKPGSVTKNNLKAFVTQNITCFEDFLLNENTLWNFLEAVDSKEIEIEISIDKIILKAGKTKVETPTEPSVNFPVNDEPDEDSLTLEDSILSAIKSASNFIQEEEIPTHRSFVFVGANNVCAGDGFIGYFEPAEDCPELVLNREIAQNIGRLQIANFSQNNSYYFFESLGTYYGFIKPEYKFFDISRISVLPSDIEGFTVNKNELIKFCDHCAASTPSAVIVCNMVCSEGNAHFEMNDKNYAFHLERDISISGIPNKDRFNFNPSLMSRLLKSIPAYQEVRMIAGEHKYYIVAEGFVSLIMEIMS